ncbi:MAG TPA: ribosomal protein S18-alanine N-acetyltransferase [Dehalococcoidia bacterium]|nr:ribosomal protein S18-alanine N-acetyltransferase [Dehalococcoidia bacterium]
MKATENKIGYFIRNMEERDIPQVLEVDHEAFPTQWPYPTYSSFKQELRNRLAHYVVVCKANNFNHSDTSVNCVPKTDNRNFISRLFNLKNNTQRDTAETLLPPAQELIIGMAGFWLMVGEAHIITIALRNSFRNMGIGEKMLISIIDRAIEMNADIVTLEVRVSNTQARELYKKYGLIDTGMRPKYYSDNGENAIIMSTQNITGPDYSLKLRRLKEAHRDRWGI